jgi:hypothetical protein
MIYNVWFMGAPTPYFFNKGYIGRLTSRLLCKAHMDVGAPRRAWATMVATWLRGSGSCANPYPPIDVHT